MDFCTFDANFGAGCNCAKAVNEQSDKINDKNIDKKRFIIFEL